MKKSILLIAVLGLLTLGFTSCEKKSAGLTQITYYADIQLEGDDYMVIEKGSTYEEPGFSATMAGQDVTSRLTIYSDLDTSKSGVYTITYSMVNDDGFPSSASRTVVVLDFNDPVEGFWYVTPTSFREYNGKVVEYGAPFEILIIGEGDGVYYVDDLFAGWYAQRAGYGSNYAMEGEIQIAADGAISLLGSLVAGWGDSVEALNDAKYDAATSSIVYQAVYNKGTMFFNVTLIKEEL